MQDFLKQTAHPERGNVKMRTLPFLMLYAERPPSEDKLMPVEEYDWACKPP